MTRSRIAIYTAVTGAYDDLRPPAVVHPDCTYLCFTDNPHLESDIWDIRQVPPDFGLSPDRRSRRIKLLPHRYLSEHFEYSIWVDANLDIGSDLVERMHAELRQRDCVFFRHPERHCLYDEAQACARLGKEQPEILEQQVAAYRVAGMPQDFGLFENSVLMRRHQSAFCRELMERWWEEFSQRSCRDQISHPYVMWRMGVDPESLAAPVARGALYVPRAHRVTRLQRVRARSLQTARTVVLSMPGGGDDFCRALLKNCIRPGTSRFPDPLGCGTVFLDPNYMQIFGPCQDDPRTLDEPLISARRLLLLLRDPRDAALRRLQGADSGSALGRVLHSPSEGLERMSRFCAALLDSFSAHPGEKLLVKLESVYGDPDAALEIVDFLLERPVDRALLMQAWREARDIFPQPDPRSAERRAINTAVDGMPHTRRLITRLDYPAGTWRSALRRIPFHLERRFSGNRSSAAL